MKNKKQKKFTDFTNPRFLAIVIALAALLAYSNTLWNDYNLDDELVTENHALTGNDFATLKNLFSEPYYKDAAGNKYEYRPMVMATFFFEFLAFGRNPHVSHCINVLLYAATCVLLFFLLRLLFGTVKYSVPLAFGITLFFLLHPLHTEVVASIKNRDELLSLFFGTIAWIFALQFADKKSWVYFPLYLLFFIAALFSKQTTITLSILIPASIVLFRQISPGSYLALLLPIALLASVFSPIYLLYKKALVFLGTTGFLLAFYYIIDKRDAVAALMRNFTSAVKIFFAHKINYKIVSGVAVALVALFAGTYLVMKQNEKAAERLKKAQYNVSDQISDFNELQLTPFLQTPAPSVIPIAGRKLDFVETPLVYVDEPAKKIGTSVYALGYYLKLMFVPYPLSFYYGYNQIPITGFGNVFVIVSLLAYAALVVAMLWLLMRQKHAIAAFGILFFLVAMVPLSNLVTPIAGIVAERLSYSASLGFCIALCYALLYPLVNEKAKFLKWTGLEAIRNARRIFGGILIVFAVLTFVRNFYWKDHLTLFRADIPHLQNSSRAHHLLASHLAYSTLANPKTPESKKKLQEAIPHFQKAIEICPDFPYAWFDLAKAYLLLDDREKAIKAYYKSTTIDTAFAPPFFELGVVLSEAGRQKEAEQAYLTALKKDANFIQAYTNLSYLYYQQERYSESIDINLKALKQHPGRYESLVNLGRTYLKIQENDHALFYLEQAAAANRSDKSLLNVIADLYQAKGDYAKEQYYRSLQ